MKLSGLSTSTCDADTLFVGLKTVLGVSSDYKFTIADLASYLGLSSSAVVHNADRLLQTTNIGLGSYSVTSTGTFRISGYVNPTIVSSSSATLKVQFFDENSVSTTISLCVGSSVAFTPANTINIRAVAGSIINALVVVSGTITYDCGVTIEYLA